jgi:hypothetical protein
VDLALPLQAFRPTCLSSPQQQPAAADDRGDRYRWDAATIAGIHNWPPDPIGTCSWILIELRFRCAGRVRGWPSTCRRTGRRLCARPAARTSRRARWPSLSSSSLQPDPVLWKVTGVAPSPFGLPRLVAALVAACRFAYPSGPRSALDPGRGPATEPCPAGAAGSPGPSARNGRRRTWAGLASGRDLASASCRIPAPGHIGEPAVHGACLNPKGTGTRRPGESLVAAAARLGRNVVRLKVRGAAALPVPKAVVPPGARGLFQLSRCGWH